MWRLGSGKTSSNDNAVENTISWVDYRGNPVEVSGEVTAYDCGREIQQIQNGELIGDISELFFRDPNCFKAGELHNHFDLSLLAEHRGAEKPFTATNVY